MTPEEKDILSLAHRVVSVLDVKAKAGRRKPSWEGYENGNGTEVGKDIEQLIRKAKRIIKQYD